MFIKKLGEKLKAQQIRAFSVDPGGSLNIPCPTVEHWLIFVAVQTGLQRHVSPEFERQVAEWSKAGSMKASFSLSVHMAC
jgi:hypothetical protein